MTASPALTPRPQRGRASRTRVDLRCAERLQLSDTHTARCQLMCGHEPPHAVLFNRAGDHVVRTWERRDVAHRDDAVDIAALPWVRGLAIPMWIEG